MSSLSGCFLANLLNTPHFFSNFSNQNYTNREEFWLRSPNATDYIWAQKRNGLMHLPLKITSLEEYNIVEKDGSSAQDFQEITL